MCQYSRAKIDKVCKTLRMRKVYKVVEIAGGKVRSYYQYTDINLGGTVSKCTLTEFKKAISKLSQVSHLNDRIKTFVKEIKGEGIHAFPSLTEARKALKTDYTEPCPGYASMILECEIPSGSGVIRGYGENTIVTNRIKYVRLIR
jgi:hypothetical protein